MRRNPPTIPKIRGSLCEWLICGLLYLLDGVISFGGGGDSVRATESAVKLKKL
jgi:hypothetical protein